jgi:hypothetical protein
MIGLDQGVKVSWTELAEGAALGFDTPQATEAALSI